ncbi:type II toxin-antitoxin system RelE/ParE family toxin [Kribbella qitaiheensis]|uniref:type II toxin-antitoxin system RelE/ParE family toxin n=1 Tax=Kribbella qitaiheensis TaxID=1544730 RepID=UPI00361F348D
MEDGIYVLDGCQKWMDSPSDKDYEALAGRVDLLSEQGPATPRPTVDTIEGSRHSNMKELRCGKYRVLFAFDPQTRAVLLIGGSKENRWTEWYKENIPIADDLFDDWLANLNRNPDWADAPDR